jgi:hypothetical protein
MHQFEAMTPAERIAFCRENIEGLSAPRSSYEQFLLDFYSKMLDELCRDDDRNDSTSSI